MRSDDVSSSQQRAQLLGGSMPYSVFLDRLGLIFASLIRPISSHGVLSLSSQSLQLSEQQKRQNIKHVARLQINARSDIARNSRHDLLCPLVTGSRQSGSHPFPQLPFSSNEIPEILISWCLQAMHAGVERDEERQRIKRERQADFEMQRRLEEEYRKIQNVPDGQNDSSRSPELGHKS